LPSGSDVASAVIALAPDRGPSLAWWHLEAAGGWTIGYWHRAPGDTSGAISATAVVLPDEPRYPSSSRLALAVDPAGQPRIAYQGDDGLHLAGRDRDQLAVRYGATPQSCRKLTRAAYRRDRTLLATGCTERGRGEDAAFGLGVAGGRIWLVHVERAIERRGQYHWSPETECCQSRPVWDMTDDRSATTLEVDAIGSDGGSRAAWSLPLGDVVPDELRLLGNGDRLHVVLGSHAEAGEEDGPLEIRYLVLAAHVLEAR
jgi:hypothetical protein